jgi:hypothetical protein
MFIYVNLNNAFLHIQHRKIFDTARISCFVKYTPQYGSCTNCIGTNCIGTICIGTNCIDTNCIGNKLYREQTVSGTYCIGNKLYREQIVSGTNCIGSLSFFYPFILFLIQRIPNQKIPNHKKFLIVNNRH